MNPGAETVTRDEIKEALGDVYDWYQSDEQHDRPILDILRDVAADLKQDRADNLRITELARYVTQDDLHNRLTPRVTDIAYTAFMAAKQPNDEDGGPSDWFNDTKPTVQKAIAKLRRDLLNETE